MKILIITRYFFPQNLIAAFRLNAFAKYFSLAGHDVTVLTDGERDETTQWNGCEVHYVKDPVMTDSYLKECIIQKKKWRLKRIFIYLQHRFFYEARYLWKTKALKRARKLCSNNNYDVILSSFGDLSAHMITLSLRRHGHNFYWVADMRDEMSKNPLLSPSNVRRMEYRERMILNEADVVVSVSAPLIDGFKSMCRHDRFLEVRNGYDYDEIHDINFQPQFTMAYVGNFYGQCFPDKWFRACSELLDERLLPADFNIKIIGGDLTHSRIMAFVPENMTSNITIIDELPHDEAIKVSATGTDVLVLMHPSGRKGVYSGKFFDYLATNKPILALYDCNDVAAALIAETNSGFVVDESDNDGIKRLILKCYGMWQRHEVLPRNWDKIRQYTRRNQTHILLDHITRHVGATKDSSISAK